VRAAKPAAVFVARDPISDPVRLEIGPHADLLADAECGWAVGASLSPGSLAGWPLTGQRDLCALLPLERIGVSLNAVGILVPFKSVTSVIGIGLGYTGRRVGSVCHLCSRASARWRRRDDPAARRLRPLVGLAPDA
jgi:hypothetical protein